MSRMYVHCAAMLEIFALICLAALRGEAREIRPKRLAHLKQVQERVDADLMGENNGLQWIPQFDDCFSTDEVCNATSGQS